MRSPRRCRRDLAFEVAQPSGSAGTGGGRGGNLHGEFFEGCCDDLAVDLGVFQAGAGNQGEFRELRDSPRHTARQFVQPLDGRFAEDAVRHAGTIQGVAQESANVFRIPRLEFDFQLGQFEQSIADPVGASAVSGQDDGQPAVRRVVTFGQAGDLREHFAGRPRPHRRTRTPCRGTDNGWPRSGRQSIATGWPCRIRGQVGIQLRTESMDEPAAIDSQQIYRRHLSPALGERLGEDIQQQRLAAAGAA